VTGEEHAPGVAVTADDGVLRIVIDRPDRKGSLDTAAVRQLALAADLTVAAEDSRFWLPFTTRGFTPDSGATWLVPRLVGVARAKEMLLLGRPVTGRDAAAWGMIHRAVPADSLDAAADELVAELRTSATVAVGLNKRCIHAALDGGVVDAMADEALMLEMSSRTADFREGLRAFTERRPARFEGR